MEVLVHPEAEAELEGLPPDERVSVRHAFEKLEVAGDRLRFPHSSAVQGAEKLRELRPRGGRSPWRAFYRRVADVMVVASIGPEAEVNRRGFRRAIKLAEQRLDDLDEEQA